MMMQCLVIDLPRLQYRADSLRNWLPANWVVTKLSDLGLHWDHLSNQKQWPNIEYSVNWKINSENSWWSRRLKAGEICCSLAHHEAWLLASKFDGETLIIEDDAFAGPDIEICLREAIDRVSMFDPEWDLLYCGRVAMSVDQKFCEEKLVVPGYSHCTYGYLLSKKGAFKLLSSNILKNMMPVDEFLPAHYVKHPRDDIARLQFQEITAYAVQPDIIFQRHKSIFGSETESSSML